MQPRPLRKTVPAGRSEGRARRVAARATGLVPVLALALGALGCVMPNRGTPVYVDQWAGSWWSGKGVLLEVSDDRERCLIAARNRALVVEKKWVDCRRVHPRKGA